LVQHGYGFNWNNARIDLYNNAELSNEIWQSAKSGAIFGGGLAFGGLGIAAAPLAAVGYFGATGVYTLGRNYLDDINASPIVKGVVDTTGILTGMALIREDLRTLTNSNGNQYNKLQAIGDFAFNLGIGTSVFSGIGHSINAPGLTRDLTDAESISERQAILQQALSDVTGQNVNVIVPEGKGFYRIPGEAQVEIGAGEFMRSSSRLAGNALHEGMHVIQGFEGNSTTSLLIDWSASVFPGRSGLAGIANKAFSFFPGYIFNPVEIAAQSAGIFSTSVNFIGPLGLRVIQALPYRYR